MRIYIPTRGRQRQRTVERLSAKVLDKFKATIVCPPSEVRGHQSAYGDRVDVIGCKRDGIAATRQFILDTSTDEVVLMIDDDLPTWCHRISPTNKYRKADDADIFAHLTEFAKLMKGYAHGSIGHRLFCQEQEPIYHNSRMLRALAYNLNKIDKARFRLRVMEDFDMALQLMSAGQDSMIYNMLVQDQYATNSDGGCSAYRTLDVQAAAAHELAKRWPDVVSVVTRAPKRQWVGLGEVRTDVRVNWRKAAKMGGCRYA